MTTCIALLRGINVGGHNRLKMAALRSNLEALGLRNVRTYIQSGNVVFDVDADELGAPDPDTDEWEVLGERIASRIEERHGFRPRTLVFPTDRLIGAMEANPFPDAEAEPRRLHLYFLANPPDDPDVTAIDERAASTERWALRGDVLYLHAPDGIGRSKLASSAERHLGVPATARNWRTLLKLREMVEETGAGSG